MKKLFTFLIAGILAMSGAFAQKGDWVLSGSLTFDYLSPEKIDGNRNGESFLNFRFAPSLLYGFNDYVYFGGELSADMHYYKTYENDQMTDEDYRNMFGIAPILRCYAFHGRRIGIFNDTKVGVAFGVDKAKTDYTTVTASMTPGIEFFINSRFSISASLNEMISFVYEHSNPEGDNNSTSQSYFGLVFNRTEINYAPLTLTFSYHFPVRKQTEVEIIEIDEYRIIK